MDVYIGGAEHSVLHLLYVRFLAMVFKDLKLVHFEEPFPKFRAHGLIIKDGAKMSKSKGNVINPDDYIKNFGADALRMYLMFLGPFEDGGDFSDTGIRGVIRFLNRVWVLCNKPEVSVNNKSLDQILHKTIKKVTEDIEAMRFNTAISSMMILANEMEKSTEVSLAHYKMFLQILAPFAPHMSEELWDMLGEKKSIHLSLWPEWDATLIVDEEVRIAIQINGKVRAEISIGVEEDEETIKKKALGNEAILKHIAGQEPKRVIYVKNRLINIVI